MKRSTTAGIRITAVDHEGMPTTKRFPLGGYGMKQAHEHWDQVVAQQHDGGILFAIKIVDGDVAAVAGPWASDLSDLKAA